MLAPVAAGSSNAETAARIFLEEATVKTRVSRVVPELGRRERVKAVALAHESGLVRLGR